MKKKVCLIVPSLTAGGMERVMSEIANHFACLEKIETILILLTKKKKFYPVDKRIQIIEPDFSKHNNRLLNIVKTIRYLRKTLSDINPYSVLSFGSMYNSFVMISCVLLDTKIYLSDRSNPYRNSQLTFKKDSIKRHDGITHYFLKKILYRFSDGIIVQTEIAKKIEKRNLKHNNVIVIPNPIKEIVYSPVPREKVILNVGRFIELKNQINLIEIFSDLISLDLRELDEWTLVFVGEGPMLKKAKDKVLELGISRRVLFEGEVSDIDKFYSKSEIFAFMSISEGFPNVLGEALKTPMACISLDCIAGPSDLIINNHNGFLIKCSDIDSYKDKLKELMINENLREKFRGNSFAFMKKFSTEKTLSKLVRVLTT